jgi:hypothetical protein
VVPLPLLKLMDQSRYGVIRVMEEAQAHPLIVATLRFIQLQEPLSEGATPLVPGLPHDVIDPSALRAAKPLSVE